MPTDVASLCDGTVILMMIVVTCRMRTPSNAAVFTVAALSQSSVVVTRSAYLAGGAVIMIMTVEMGQMSMAVVSKMLHVSTSTMSCKLGLTGKV